MNKVLIGTSGYNYKHWKDVFYPKDVSQKNWLSYYSKYFDTVEINATFYGNFKKNVFEKWGREVPRNFRFCLKGSRFITHVKRLNNVDESLNIFLSNAQGLGKKLNIILWQFPRSFVLKNKGGNKINEENFERLKNFLKILPKNIRQAFEFRHDSWFTDQTFDFLNKYKMGIVIPDSPAFKKLKIRTNNFAYIRFHGAKALYSSNYTDKELKSWAITIKQLLKKGDVYCYFNNDVQGFAVKNALKLKEILIKAS